MSAGKYDALLFAKHGLCSPALEPKHGMHKRMCMTNKRTSIRLSYNTNNGKEIKWSQEI